MQSAYRLESVGNMRESRRWKCVKNRSYTFVFLLVYVRVCVSCLIAGA